MFKIGVSFLEFCMPALFAVLLQPSASLALITIIAAILVFN